MFVLTMTLVTTVIVRLTGSFKKMLSKMITRDRKKDFVIFASKFAISQTEYLVRKNVQVHSSIMNVMKYKPAHGVHVLIVRKRAGIFQIYFHRYHQKEAFEILLVILTFSQKYLNLAIFSSKYNLPCVYRCAL